MVPKSNTIKTVNPFSPESTKQLLDLKVNNTKTPRSRMKSYNKSNKSHSKSAKRAGSVETVDKKVSLISSNRNKSKEGIQQSKIRQLVGELNKLICSPPHTSAL